MNIASFIYQLKNINCTIESFIYDKNIPKCILILIYWRESKHVKNVNFGELYVFKV